MTIKVESAEPGQETQISKPNKDGIAFAILSEKMLRAAWHLCYSSQAKAEIDSLLHYCGKRTESRAQRPLLLTGENS